MGNYDMLPGEEDKQICSGNITRTLYSYLGPTKNYRIQHCFDSKMFDPPLLSNKHCRVWRSVVCSHEDTSQNYHESSDAAVGFPLPCWKMGSALNTFLKGRIMSVFIVFFCFSTFMTRSKRTKKRPEFLRFQSFFELPDMDELLRWTGGITIWLR